MMVVSGDSGAAPVSIQPTEREKQILELVAQGYTAREIGHKLGISPRTTQKRVDVLCDKARARNKTHLAALAVVYGWVQAIDPAPEIDTDLADT